MAAKKKAAAKRPVGRPSKYTPEVAALICERIGTGLSLTKACLPDDVPHPITVRRWVLGIGIPPEHVDEFRQNYAAARELQAEVHFDELYDDAVDCRPDTGHVGKGKLKADAIKWRLARMNRAKYGDKADINLGGGDKPIATETKAEVRTDLLDPEERKALRDIGRRLATKGTSS